MKIGIVAHSSATIDALHRAASLSEHQIAWSCGDVASVIELCGKDVVELVLVDLSMNDGVEVTRQVVAQTPCTVLAVTTDVGEDIARVFQAMGHGAIDAVDAPPRDASNWQLAVAPFVAKLNAVARRIARQRRREADGGKPAQPHRECLVAIGASAGGPAALVTLLAALPQNFPAAIVIVQHVDQQFAPDMATWLGQHARIPVRVAAEGDRPQAGVALLASTNDHLVLKTADRLGYTAHPRAQVYRPSVDVFFHSVEAHWRGEAVGVVLTGMGRDGAQGLKALRAKGCYTITQDKATSAVYGMPQAAAGAAVDVLPLAAIATRLIDHFASFASGG